MAADDMISRAVPAVPKDDAEFRRWSEKILRQHYHDLRALLVGGTAPAGPTSTVEEEGVQVGDSDIVTLDFREGFDIEEDVDTHIKINLDFSEVAGHDLFTDFAANEHLSLPNTVANVLTDGDFGAKNISTTGIGTFGEINIGDTGSAGTLLAIATAATTPGYTGLLELMAPDGTHFTTAAMLSIDAFRDPAAYEAKAFGLSCFYKPKGVSVGGFDIALFGATAAEITAKTAIGAGDVTLTGLQFECYNTEDFSTSSGVIAKTITTRGLYVGNQLGYANKEIGGSKCKGVGYGIFTQATMAGEYNSSLGAGENYGIKVQTINEVTDATANITSYALYVDACAGSSEGSGGVITSWGIYEANGIMNAFAGNVRIGSTVAPTVALDVTGAVLVSTTLDVIGNIDPTSYETTRGGFKDEDDMASDSDVATASQQSIAAYVEARRIQFGPNLITNGTFTTNLDNWSVNDVTQSGGKACWSSVDGTGYLDQDEANMDGVIGNHELYYIKFTISNTNWGTDGGLRIDFCTNMNYRIYQEPDNGIYEFFMTAGPTGSGLGQLRFDLYASGGSTPYTCDIDDVILKKVSFVYP